jgi:hypothetical protein
MSMMMIIIMISTRMHVCKPYIVAKFDHTQKLIYVA